MKTCPVCKATLFDDMDVCYGCMHRFASPEEGKAVESQTQLAASRKESQTHAPSTPGALPWNEEEARRHEPSPKELELLASEIDECIKATPEVDVWGGPGFRENVPLQSLWPSFREEMPCPDYCWEATASEEASIWPHSFLEDELSSSEQVRVKLLVEEGLDCRVSFSRQDDGCLAVSVSRR